MAETVIGIIGGGPAGLFSAIHIAAEGLRIIVCEKKAHAGRKLLITGSGRCNITHDGGIADFFPHYGDNGAFLKACLRGYTNRDLISFFEEHGCPVITDDNNKIFPASGKASDILSILTTACRERGVEIRTGTPVTAVSRTGDRFILEAESGDVETDILIIATGGASYPSTGSTGDGYRFGESLGHRIEEIGPALSPVYPEEYPLSDLAGISFDDLTVSIQREGKIIRKVSGDLLLTHEGLSGPVILHASRFIRKGDTVRVAFLPEKSQGDINRILTEGQATGGKRLVRTILAQYPIPVRFIQQLIVTAGVADDCTIAHLRREDRLAIASLLTAWPFQVRRVGGFEEAMVTRGGVALDEVSPKTMESKLVKNLYFIGEVLDIDGDTGGYNLQAAFSTAIAAARDINKKGISLHI